MSHLELKDLTMQDLKDSCTFQRNEILFKKSYINTKIKLIRSFDFDTL